MGQQLGKNVTYATEELGLQLILVTLLIVLLHWFVDVPNEILEQTFNPGYIGVFFAQQKPVVHRTILEATLVQGIEYLEFETDKGLYLLELKFTRIGTY